LKTIQKLVLVALVNLAVCQKKEAIMAAGCHLQFFFAFFFIYLGALVNLAVSQKNKDAIVAAGGHLQVLECMKKSAGNVCVCVWLEREDVSLVGC
jgi:hypothetical protein